ncbi:MAG: TerB family tellurite resistance protein [Muribaculaceae bacterium]|nr:TerB family tellurite resistance protein [Muribaculaceae bacterium]
MEDIRTLEKVIRLVAKTGLFFAKVDGEYSDRERAFLQAYIDQLVNAGGTPEEVQALIGNIEEQNITLDNVVADTREVLQCLPDNDARIVKITLYSYISDIVAADGDDCPAEKAAFEAWCEALY